MQGYSNIAPRQYIDASVCPFKPSDEVELKVGTKSSSERKVGTSGRFVFLHHIASKAEDAFKHAFTIAW